MAAADLGQYGSEAAKDTSSLLERALLCERLNWRVLPHELEEVGLELSQALGELAVYRSFQQYAKDLERLGPEQGEIVAWVEEMRSHRAQARLGPDAESAE